MKPGGRDPPPQKKLGARTLSLESSLEGWADPPLGVGKEPTPPTQQQPPGQQFSAGLSRSPGPVQFGVLPLTLPTSSSLSVHFSLAFSRASPAPLSSAAALAARALPQDSRPTGPGLSFARGGRCGPPPLCPAGPAPVGAALPGATTRRRQLPVNRPWVWSQGPCAPWKKALRVK